MVVCDERLAYVTRSLGQLRWQYRAVGGRAGWTRQMLDVCVRRHVVVASTAAGPAVTAGMLVVNMLLAAFAAALRGLHCVKEEKGRDRRAGRAARRWGPVWAPVARRAHL